jgi:hypothetical protein
MADRHEPLRHAKGGILKTCGAPPFLNRGLACVGALGPIPWPRRLVFARLLDGEWPFNTGDRVSGPFNTALFQGCCVRILGLFFGVPRRFFLHER